MRPHARSTVRGASLLWVLVAGPVTAQEPRTVTPRAGLVITTSVRLTPGAYHLSAPRSLDSALLTVRGDDVTVDMRGVTLEGTAAGADPDQAAGIAIRVEGGHDVRILHGRIHGYRFGILVQGTRRITLDDNDVGGSWRPRLFSLLEHESLVDWLSFHHNDHGEWLRYGAGIYLDSVSGGTVHGNQGEQSMNGLMLTRSDHLEIWDNDFSFNSGLGIGLYRSSDNNIQHNRLDYDVRGYSHKFYHRGQDSAGLLLFEQSSRNIIAYNSVTHGGDGLFLWAGQSTMDSGVGGCNDNLIYGNDFSYAAANGIEVTFSRNTIVANGIVGNDYGIWGGYSYDTQILGNGFALNRTGIAIEHGQDNRVVGNDFRRDTTAVSLWADSVAPSDWGYPKHRDTRSKGYDLDSNRLLIARVAFRIRSSDAVRIIGNTWIADSALVLRDTTGLRIADNHALPYPHDDSAWDSRAHIPSGYGRYAPPPLDDTVIPRTSASAQGRAAIVVDEWGPYQSGTPRVSALLFEPFIDWTTKFFVWSDSTDPRTKPDAFQALLGGSPALTRHEPRLDYEWYRPTIPSLPLERWALQAEGTVTLGPGTYTIRTISDDAVRVWVDGKLAIDDWTPHESVVDHAPLTGGAHTLKVQYYQLDGWTELRLDIVRGTETSTGSPGPH